jgi:hypothetical protein
MNATIIIRKETEKVTGKIRKSGGKKRIGGD